MSTAYIFSPSLPHEPHGIGTAISEDLRFILSKYSSVIFITTSSWPSSGLRDTYPFVTFIYLRLSGNHRPFSFYRGDFIKAFNYIRSLRGDLYFYCWHTPLVDLLALFPRRNNQQITLISHGTFCSPRLLSRNPRLFFSLVTDLLYQHIVIPRIISRVDAVSFLAISPDSNRYSDLDYCLKYCPAKIRCNPNSFGPSRYGHLATRSQVDGIKNVDIILICRISRAKGLDKLFGITQKVVSVVNQSDVTSPLTLNIHLYSFAFPVSLPWNLGKLHSLSSASMRVKPHFHKGMSSAQIKEHMYTLENPLAISLSRTECEPYSLTEPLSIGIPGIAIEAGSISSIPGVFATHSMARLAGMVSAYLLSKSFRVFLDRAAETGARSMADRSAIKADFFDL